MKLKIHKNISVLGVGLIGGSIALGLKKAMGDAICISGFCRTKANTVKVMKAKIIDKGIFSFNQLKESELIIIAMPIKDTLEILPKLSVILSRRTLVMDVAGVKEVMTEIVRNIEHNFRFIGTHPMAGSEKRGFVNSDPDLFSNKPWIITPDEDTQQKDIEVVLDIVRLLGARPVFQNAADHDRIIAFASHMPMILGSIIANAARENPDAQEILKAASTGFGDMTRLAGHSASLKTDIIEHNRKNITDAIKSIIRETEFFVHLIANDDKNAICEYFENSQIFRGKFLKTFRKGQL